MDRVFAFALAICMVAILLEELSFNTYTVKELFLLLLAALFEVFGFRQFVTARTWWASGRGWPANRCAASRRLWAGGFARTGRAARLQDDALRVTG